MNPHDPVRSFVTASRCETKPLRSHAMAACRMLLAAVVIHSAGCGQSGPEMVQVHGRVVRNGAGVTAGAVYFHPAAGNTFQDDVPSGQLQLDGTFVISTFPFGEGIPPGNYQVTLSPELANRLERPGYGSRQTTPWKVTVTKEQMDSLVLEISAGRGTNIEPSK
ncbi:MAG: hypothetical protein ACK58L_12840 [Planctomycetota bacterium]